MVLGNADTGNHRLKLHCKRKGDNRSNCKSFCSLQENRSDRLFRPRMIPVQRTVQREACNHDEIDNKIPVVGPVEHTDQKARRDDLRLKQNVF